MMYDYDEQDFIDMTFNISLVPGDKSVFNAFPNLKKIPELSFKVSHVTINLDRVIRYLMYFYDEGSPVRYVRDINERKEKALTLAGILARDGKYPKVIEKIVSGEHDDFNKAVVFYLKFCNDPKWSLVKIYEQIYYSNLIRAKNGEFKDTNKLKNDLITLTEAQQSFLADDNNKNLVKAFYDYTHQEELDLSPEGVVAKEIRLTEESKKEKKSKSNKAQRGIEVFSEVKEV